MKIIVENQELFEKVKDLGMKCLCKINTPCMCDDFTLNDKETTCYCGVFKKEVTND